MVCRKIVQKNPWNRDRWWRWVYSAAAPPLRVASACTERENFGDTVSRVQDHVGVNPRTLICSKNHHKGEFLSISFGISWRSFTTKTLPDLPVGGVVNVPLAQTGEGIAECELLKWFVLEGDEVEEFQPLCEVQSDKATIEITSRYKGKISKVLHVPGSIVKVGETLLKIVVDENVSVVPSVEASENTTAHDCIKNVLDVTDSALKKEKIGRVLSTPAVRNFAKQLDVNIEDVHGTGNEGRILKEDIMNYAARKGILKESSKISEDDSYASQYSGDMKLSGIISAYEEYEDRALPLRGFQRAMVKSMMLAAKVPHFHYVEEINCDTLVDLKASFQNENSDLGIKFSFLPLLVKSLSIALSKYPLLNSCFSEDSQEVTLKGSHNIGIAMATQYGLVVPNIKRVQSLSILEITKELLRLQELALSNKLSTDDISGGTITMSNIGSIGGKFGSPLVNVPEVSIIALGRIQKVPHFDDDGNLYPVSVMTVNVGADHRVLDGATVARFCNEWKRLVEQPELLILHMR